MPPLPNARHERMAQVLASGENATKSYESAGYTSHRHNAAALARQEHISTRASEILAERAAIHSTGVVQAHPSQAGNRQKHPRRPRASPRKRRVRQRLERDGFCRDRAGESLGSDGRQAFGEGAAQHSFNVSEMSDEEIHQSLRSMREAHANSQSRSKRHHSSGILGP